MFWEDRGFVQPATQAEVEFNTPDLKDKNDVNLMKAITQEHVSMLKRVKKEEKERIYQDSLLQDEMHSFGMIACDLFDKELKFIKLVIADDAVVDLPCRSTSATSFKVLEDTYRVTIQKGTTIYLYPVGRGTTSKKQFVGAYGLRHVGGALLAFNITYTDFYANTLNVSLSDCFYTSNEIILPDGEQAPAEVSIALNDMEGYK